MRARTARAAQIGPVRRVAVALVLSLLLVLSTNLHVAYDTPAFAGADVTDMGQVTNAEHQPDRSLPDALDGVHCHSSGSCPCCAPVALAPFFLHPGPDDWPFRRATSLAPPALHSHFRPPRLPAHA